MVTISRSVEVVMVSVKLIELPQVQRGLAHGVIEQASQFQGERAGHVDNRPEVRQPVVSVLKNRAGFLEGGESVPYLQSRQNQVYHEEQVEDSKPSIFVEVSAGVLLGCRCHISLLASWRVVQLQVP